MKSEGSQNEIHEINYKLGYQGGSCDFSTYYGTMFPHSAMCTMCAAVSVLYIVLNFKGKYFSLLLIKKNHCDKAAAILPSGQVQQTTLTVLLLTALSLCLKKDAEKKLLEKWAKNLFFSLSHR